MSHSTPEELKTLFLFEGLTDEQRIWLAERAERVTYGAGAAVHRAGETADHLYVLLDGRVRQSRTLNGEEVTTNETSYRGAYAGATRAYLDQPDKEYIGSLTAVEPSTFLRWRSQDFSEFVHTQMPMAIHLLDGIYNGVRMSEATIQQREHLARLGTLSANLAHELNNPAAAAVRATGQLRDRVAGMRHKLGMIAAGHIAPETIVKLVGCQERAIELAAKRREDVRTPMQVADLEDALVDRLDEIGVTASYDLAPIFAASGLDVPWLDDVVRNAGDDELDGAMRWLAYSLETESLMNEIEDATSRISTLVGSVKQYAYLDSSAVQEVDVHVGLDSTVVMLGHKLAGVEVVREYDRTIPKVPVYAAELNQVWTNLIDNAADAMGGSGKLTLRTRMEEQELVVEVADDGPGIPEAVQPRVYEAFFTTKPQGEGSGLGLETAKRIVVKRHHGGLSFDTGPTGTCFQVRLPLTQRLT
jgi:signal transduction histidine kinase